MIDSASSNWLIFEHTLWFYNVVQMHFIILMCQELLYQDDEHDAISLSKYSTALRLS